MIQIEPAIFSLLDINFDVRRVIKRLQQHPAIFLSIAALYVIFPDHFVLVEPSAGNKQIVAGYKILFNEGVGKRKITKVLAHFEDERLAFSALGIKFLSPVGIQQLPEVRGVFSFVTKLLDVIEKAHAQGIRVETNARQGCHTGMGPGKIHLMPPNTVILQK